MTQVTEDTALIRHALAYAIELYRELTDENGAPSLGTQNQTVDFILDDPQLRSAIEAWARTAQTDEATTAPPRRLPRDEPIDGSPRFCGRRWSRRFSPARGKLRTDRAGIRFCAGIRTMPAFALYGGSSGPRVAEGGCVAEL